MINNYFIWDKESPINGSSAKDVLASDSKFINNIVVFFTENDKPNRHAFLCDIRLELNMQSETDEEVCQAYLKKIQLAEENTQKEQVSLEEQAIKIDILQAENADILLDSANKDIKMKTLEKDLADLTLQIVGGIQ